MTKPVFNTVRRQANSGMDVVEIISRADVLGCTAHRRHALSQSHVKSPYHITLSTRPFLLNHQQDTSKASVAISRSYTSVLIGSAKQMKHDQCWARQCDSPGRALRDPPV